ncbi:MAG: methyltransferase domain-containing protein [Bacteroidota bacterium]
MASQKEPALFGRGELTDIYDSLFDFESKNKSGSYPIHKKVSIEGQSLLEWVTAKLDFSNSLRVLDAGCGTGNTLFQLNEQFGITGVGLSVSPKEIEFAKQHAEITSVQDSLFFYCRDFSKSIKDLGFFDVIIAIESLKHNEDPFSVIQRFVGQLNPGGTLIIVDDFIIGDTSSQHIEKHKSHWSAPGFISIRRLKEKLEAFGINYQLTDLSKFVPTKKKWLQTMILGVLKAMKVFLNSSASRFRNLETYEGAILLEKLYRKGETGYYMVVCRG